MSLKDAPGRRIRMHDVAYFYLAGEDSGYVVVPAGGTRGSAHVLYPKPQSSAPRPGPTLAIQLVRHARFRRLGLKVRIAPAATTQQAAEEASRLRAKGRSKPKSGPRRPRRG